MLQDYEHIFFTEMLGEGGEGPADLANYDHEAPVLHVLVVGFHHKKGCQVIKKNCGDPVFQNTFFPG